MSQTMIGRRGLPAASLAVVTVVLAISLPSAVMRYLIFGLPLWVAAQIMGWSDTAVQLVALGLALYPLIGSIAALVLPMPGALVRQRFGARVPSTREHALYEDALRAILSRHPEVTAPRDWCVVDTAEFAAAVLGDTLMVLRDTLRDGTLESTLAHELGHLHYRDGRLALAIWRTTALARLLPARSSGGLISMILALARYIASGEPVLRLTTPLWATNFRQAEYRADAFAARLGYATALADYFETILPYDRPVPFLWMSQHTNPPVELRIDRLRTLAQQHPDQQVAPFTPLEPETPSPPDERRN